MEANSLDVAVDVDLSVASGTPPRSRPRPLVKGPLKPPRSQLQCKNPSYTQAPALKTEVVISAEPNAKKKQAPVVEFNSRAIHQPFLDPTILEERVLGDKRRKEREAKMAKAGEGFGVGGN